ncbi:unnamed protein product [Sphenostylis stenocarpa]|uniref:Uncharacterized protein n=1 Tax=Sphenostylis stenocarpa TaxID=92480 RepID=A0AA86S962_9FABA|nr:unnamed protein product [Sphenostylis stenocarpa]
MVTSIQTRPNQLQWTETQTPSQESSSESPITAFGLRSSSSPKREWKKKKKKKKKKGKEISSLCSVCREWLRCSGDYWAPRGHQNKSRKQRDCECAFVFVALPKTKTPPPATTTTST